MRHRVTNYGTEINTSYTNINFEEIEIKAKILISKFYNDFEKKNITKDISELFDFLLKTNFQLQKESNFLCKSSDVYVNPSTVPNIQNRLKETITKQCPWSIKEINLLKS